MIGFRLNGQAVTVQAGPLERLSKVLRENLGARGTKVGCDAGDCGACTVLVDGRSVCACLTPVAQVSGCDVDTVEGDSAILTRLRAAFLRHGAAQCGICTPGMLMASVELLARAARPSEPEVEAALAGVLCRCTGYRKIIAAVRDAWRVVEVPAASGAVGQAIARIDGAAKVAGDLFGADVVPEGAMMVKAVRSPHAYAGFAIGDVAAWVAGRGVVFTATDIPGRNAFGVIPAFADQPAIADGVAKFRGECVALVAFEPGVAPDLAGFPVEWAPLPAVATPQEAEAVGAALVHPHRPGNQLIEGRVKRGDVGAALAGSAYIVAGTMTTAFVEHAYIEPEAGAAWMQGDVLCIRASTQAPVMDRDEVAGVLALPTGRVRILPCAVGGGFGSKLDVSVQPLLGLVTLKTGRPCRMVYERGESMTSTTKRHPAEMQGRIGCDANGLITGMEFEGRFNTGAYSSWGPTVANRVPVHVTGPYFTPAVSAKARAVHTHGPVSGAFRGFGVPQAALWQETLYDRLADKVGLDRLEFRLRNALRDGQVSATGQVMQSVGIAECLQALRPHWLRALADAAPGYGVGIAACWYGCGNTALPNPSTIRIGLRRDGQLVLHQGATDIGQGSNTVIAQIAAQAMEVPVAAFVLVGPDTALTPDAGKTSASRQTFVSGRAAMAAGLAMKAALQRTGFGVIDTRALPLDRFGYVLSVEESYDPPTQALDADGQGSPYAVYGYGAQMVELQVDRGLGTVRLLKITAAHDVGRAINPMLVEGQIEGGIAQGIGMALMEEYLPGRTENLHDYLIPTVGDVPPIESLIIEVPDADGPYGAKGLGEHVLIPTAPAILNAIRHATGAEIAQVPALPHRVLAAIQAVRHG